MISLVVTILTWLFTVPVAQARPTPAMGSVEGRVLIELPRPRRAPDRYPGGFGAPHEVQSIPVVAWIDGPVAGARAQPVNVVMAQRDTAFAPSLLVVPVGSTVRFPNQDEFFHNVFSYSGSARFDLGRYPQGESKGVQLDEPGIVKVYCEVHDFMRGAIVVTENPFHAVVGADGRFRFTGVPPGQYTLMAWHADLGLTETTVVVPASGVARVELELR